MDYSKIYPLMGTQAHGAIGKWWIHKTYVINTKRYGIYQNHGRVICKYAYPYNPRTVIQQTPRNFFAYAINNWTYFSNNEKSYYNEIVGNRPLSGYNYYIGLYLRANKYIPPAEEYMLMETGDFMLSETEDYMVIE